jgi:ribose-phosphate pyrophosphokinase
VTPLFLALPGNEALAEALAGELRGSAAAVAAVASRRFPDGEAYVRIDAPCAGRDAALVCTLDHPDEKILPLLFAAETLRELGARRVGLVSPYLAYLRQDRRFEPGEAVSSWIFAGLVSSRLDWLVTVDPHLHRIHALAEIFTIPTRAVAAAPALAAWVAAHVARPLLVGPDQESEQWVADVARRAGAPYLVLTKVRRGDREVEVSLPDVEPYRDRTPVVLDDIISSARTMAQAADLIAAGLPAPVCLAVHAIFAGDAQRVLEEAGAARIVTTKTVPHPTNEIEIAGLLTPALLTSMSGSPESSSGH